MLLVLYCYNMLCALVIMEIRREYLKWSVSLLLEC